MSDDRIWWTTYSLNPYLALHRRLRAERGPATRWLCELCPPGTPDHLGAEFACTAEPADLVSGISGSGQPVLYSPRLVDYVPACLSAHRRYDAARARERRATAHVLVSPLPAKRPEPARDNDRHPSETLVKAEGLW